MAEFFFYLMVYLVARVFRVHTENQLSWPKVTAVAVLSALTLLLTEPTPWTIVVGLLFVIPAVLAGVKRNGSGSMDLLELVVGILLLAAAFGGGSRGASTAGVIVAGFLFDLFPALEWVTTGEWEKVWAVAAAFIFTLSDYNLLIRMILDSTGFKPSGIKQREYRAGRLIGVLERLVILLLFLAGSPGGVGLVVTAKGLIRFRELRDRDFAEYFLLGTLLSISGALIIAAILKGTL